MRAGLPCRLAGLVALTLLSGCAAPFSSARRFNFEHDTVTFENGLYSVYHRSAGGAWLHEPRQPPPEYAQHCFVVARSVRQFFQHARFDPSQPAADEAAYRRLIRRVVAIDPIRTLSDSKRVVIPGYADLRSFSRDHEPLLKRESGGTWQSYVQRGNWRMIWPFHRSGQEREVLRLLADLKVNRPPVVHLVSFTPAINHAVLIFDAKQDDKEISFTVYDPNNTRTPGLLTYRRASRTFNFPETSYWPGGRVDVYEIYRTWNY